MPCGTWKTFARSARLLPSMPPPSEPIGHARHALDAAGDHELLRARADAHRREVHGLQPRAAEAVQRDAA